MPPTRFTVCFLLAACLLFLPAAARTQGAPETPADDFSGDCCDDVFVGVPDEDLPAGEDAGYVNVFYGQPEGISTINAQGWDQTSATVIFSAGPDEKFGSTLASGDFNGDGEMDLAIGAPLEDIGGVKLNAGSVTVMYGSPVGLANSLTLYIEQGRDGVAGVSAAEDLFGSSLAAGDFNRDGYTDLAIGSPNDDLFPAENCGAVNVLFGSRSGLTPQDQEYIFQGATLSQQLGANDNFGAALTAGDYNQDSYVDLAVGVPGEDFDEIAGVGIVHVLSGSPTGLLGTPNFVLRQGLNGIFNSVGYMDSFGNVLASGDFDGDGKDDLAIGVPYEDTSDTLLNVGLVHVVYGAITQGWLGAQSFFQGDNGVSEVLEAQDQFGYALTAGDFNADGRDDLAIGVPRESYGAYNQTGVVQVLYGSPNGLTTLDDDVWAQNVENIFGDPETYDVFGWSLAAGRINDDVYFDLVIGIPGDATNGVHGGGIEVIYGSASGLTNGAEPLYPSYLSQYGARTPETDEIADRFGNAVATSYCPTCRYPIYVPLTFR